MLLEIHFSATLKVAFFLSPLRWEILLYLSMARTYRMYFEWKLAYVVGPSWIWCNSYVKKWPDASNRKLVRHLYFFVLAIFCRHLISTGEQRSWLIYLGRLSWFSSLGLCLQCLHIVFGKTWILYKEECMGVEKYSWWQTCKINEGFFKIYTELYCREQLSEKHPGWDYFKERVPYGTTGFC